MPTLIPNGTVDRLRYIAKTYASKPGIVLDMVSVVAMTVGEDNWEQRVRGSAKFDSGFLKDTQLFGLVEPVGFGNPFREQDRRRDLAAGRRHTSSTAVPTTEYVRAVVELVSELYGFRGIHSADPIFPWMATQLAKAAKQSIREQAAAQDDPVEQATAIGVYYSTLIAFRQRGTLLAQWFVAERPDLTKMSAGEVLEAAREWDENQEAETAADLPGEVVYKFDDGFTIQKLTTESQLEAEGEAMQHCVGGYCEHVQSGRSVIYSLRDPHGHPHSTIEYDPRVRRIVQIQGKQNEDPAPKYRERADRFTATLPMRPKKWQEIYDILQHDSSSTDDDELPELTDAWDAIVSTPAEVKAWLGFGVPYDTPRNAEEYQEEGLSAEEMGHWPYPVLEFIAGGDIHDHEYVRPGGKGFGELVRIGRFGARLVDLQAAEHLLSEIAAGRTDVFGAQEEGMYGWDELERAGLAIKKSRGPSTRFIGTDFVAELTPLGRRLSVAPEQLVLGLEEKARKFKSKWKWNLYKDPDHWRPILEQAERWALTDLDPDPGSNADFEPWYWEGFTPEEADRWYNVDRGASSRAVLSPDVAAVLQRRGIKPAQVEELIKSTRYSSSKRLSVHDLRDADRISDVLGLAANRRARG